jgi:hypothetical protein
MCLLYFHNIYTNIFIVQLKHSSFWPSFDVKWMSNDIVHAMCMFALSLSLHVYNTISIA